MRVDGRDIAVSGSLLQPLTRRTNDILRLTLAAVFLVVLPAPTFVSFIWTCLASVFSTLVAGPLGLAAANH